MLIKSTLASFSTLIQVSVILISSAFSASAQSPSKEQMDLLPGTNKVIRNQKNQSIKYAQLQQNKVALGEHLDWINANVKPKQDEITLQLFRVEKDQIGFEHYRYRQYYKNVRVEYGVCYAHTKANYLVSVNGELYPEINTSVIPAFDKKEAFNKALATIPAEKYQYTDARGTPILQDSIELLVFPRNNQYYLAYKVDVYAAKPLRRAWVYINALTGETLFTEERIHHTDVPATAQTGYNGNVTMTTDQTGPGAFRLRASKGFGGINTYNMLNGENYDAAIDITDTDNVWDGTGIEKFSYDAHYGAESTYEYYKGTYGRNSYDNNGASINSYVHYSMGYVNAFWDGKQMTYGDGDSQNTPLTSIDVVGHEITHAVTEHSAALVYADESGGLNESFSDCFGVAIDYYRNPASANFLMGEMFNDMGVPFRNMGNPSVFNNPDTYNGVYWNDPNEVHNNSGVQNFWFYLLTMGGSGTNDLGDAYVVDSIGIEAAAAVAYRNLTVYLTPNSTYSDANVYAILAAGDLYGSCSNVVKQVTNAWYAVGLGSPYQNTSIANFKAEDYSPCHLPLTVQFDNLSINADTFLWNFGDGSSSTDVKPSHVYTAAGQYTVQLMASSAACGASDMTSKTNYITVYDGYSPSPASCKPATTGYCCGAGILGFNFGTISKSSGDGEEGYQDYTCSEMTTVVLGETVAISALTGDGFNEDLFVWIDYNNDSELDSVSELVFQSFDKYINHSGTIVIPTTAVINTPLRMRVMSDFEGRMNQNSCKTTRFGQAEDYTLRIVANTPLPIADFVADKLLVDVGGTVNFTDLTKNIPTAWKWTLTGASVLNPTDQNPSVTYNQVGVYPAKLVASNSFGSDSITKNFYITVVEMNTMCTDTQSSSKEGLLYDSGGETGNYKSSESCVFTISPSCVNSITLTFEEFNTQVTNDKVSVFDGNGVLLLEHSGPTIPFPVTANTGSMRVEFKSNFGLNLSGFKAKWTSESVDLAVTDFAWIQDAGTGVAFEVSETGTNAYNYTWNFGDGSSSTDKYATHNFASAKCYDVEMIATDPFSSCSETILRQVCLNPAGSNAEVLLFPNPSSSVMNLKLTSALQEFEIHDVHGKRVSYKLNMLNAYQYTLDMRNLEDGPYFLTINGKVYKIIKYND